MHCLSLGHNNLHMLRKEKTEVSLEVAFHQTLPSGECCFAAHPSSISFIFPICSLCCAGWLLHEWSVEKHCRPCHWWKLSSNHPPPMLLLFLPGNLYLRAEDIYSVVTAKSIWKQSILWWASEHSWTPSLIQLRSQLLWLWAIHLEGLSHSVLNY